MKPILWGPSVWQALFACAWACPAQRLDRLLALIQTQVPPLLPCAKCREHFARHVPRVNRRARGEPRDAEHAFRWLWYLKDEVNATLRRPSITLEDLTERYLLHGAIVDDVALGDTLVLLALSAHELQRDDVFVDLCQTLAVLLPLPHDSCLRKALAAITERPVVPAAVRAAKAARIERGLRPLTLSHYRAASE